MCIFNTVFVIISAFVAISNSQRIHQAFFDRVSQKALTWKPCFNYDASTPSEFYTGVAGKPAENYFQARNKTRNLGMKMLRHVESPDEMVPRQFDVRTKWPQCQTYIDFVLDQGICRNCWLLTPLSVMTDRLCIHSKGDAKTFLSTEDVLACCENCTQGKNSCVGGGSTYAVWAFWISKGIASANCLPNKEGEEETRNCTKTCANTRVYEQEKEHGGIFYLVSTNQEQIKLEIMKNGPVAATMELPLDFFAYKDGVYQNVEGDPIGYHIIKILGWGTEDVIPYWLCMNTFGGKWGSLGGVFKIIRGINHLKIESEVLTGRIKAELDARQEYLTDDLSVGSGHPGTVVYVVMLLLSIILNFI